MRLEYFTATWCQPCKVFGPIVDKVISKLDIPLEKVDVDKNRERVPASVMGMPTIIMYNEENVEISRIVGGRSEGDLTMWVLKAGNNV